MWESIQAMTANPLTVGLVVVLVIVGIVGVRKGWFRIHTNAITIGADEKERKILRDQFDYTNAFFDSFLTHPIFKTCDEYKVKHICDKVKDEVERAILFNHITAEGEYIRIKCDLMYSVILKRSDADFVREDSFKKQMYEEGEKLFKRLIDIRKSA